MAVLCEKEEEFPALVFPQTKVTLSESPVFSTTDTVWISGEVTSMAFNEDLQDSVANSNENLSDVISVLRLRPQNRISNTIDATADFELVTRRGSIDFLGACPQADIIANGPKTANSTSYRYEIGLVPKNTGDFVLNWLLPANLRNSNLNIAILEKYPMDGGTNELGLTRCGITSSQLDVRGARNSFFFTVE